MRPELEEGDALARWRGDTPGCAERIHLNNAGAALMPSPVSEAIVDHVLLESRIGGYEAADLREPAVEDAYRSLASLVGARRRNLAIVENATAATALAISALALERGDRIVTTHADYASQQLMLLDLRDRLGIEVRRAADRPEGGVDPESVDDLLRDGRARLVVVSWVPTNSGLIQPVEEVARVCERHGVHLLVDACQAVGQLVVDLRELPCSFLAATARKFLRGPRGIGFLAVSDAALEAGLHPALPDIRGAQWTEAERYELAPDARRFENWEFAYALVLGLGAAARYAQEVGIEAGGRRARALASRARERLRAIDGVRVLDPGRDPAAIVSIAARGVEAFELSARLRALRINTTVSPRELALIDLEAKQAAATLRLSPHYYNTVQEVDAAVDAVAEILAAG